MDISYYLAHHLQAIIAENVSKIELYIVDQLQENLVEIIFKYDCSGNFSNELNHQTPLIEITEKYGGSISILNHKGDITQSFEWPIQEQFKPNLGNFYSLFGTIMLNHPDIHFILSFLSRNGEYILDSSFINKTFSREELQQKEVLSNMNDLLKDNLNNVRYSL